MKRPHDTNRKFRRTPMQQKQHPDPTGAAGKMLAALREIVDLSPEEARGIALEAIAAAKAAGITEE